MKKLFLSIALIIAGVTLTLAIQNLLDNKIEQKDLALEETTLNNSNKKQDNTSIQKEIKLHETDEKLEEQASSDKIQDNRLIKASHDNNTKKVTATGQISTEIKQPTMEERFAQEDTDYEWSPQQENKIFNLLNDNILGEDAWTEKTECKSSLCKIEINYSMSAMPLISETIKLLTESEGDANHTSYDMTSMQGDKGYMQVILFHIRK